MKFVYTVPLLLITLLCPELNAQNSRYIGGVVGVQNTWIRNQNNYDCFDCPQIAGSVIDYDLTFGYNGGLSVGFELNKGHAIQVDVLYSLMGQDYADEYLPGAGCPNPYDVERQVEITYLQIPLLYKPYLTNREKNMRYFLLAGFQLGMKLGTNDKITVVGDPKEGNELLVAEEDKYSDIDFGFKLGAGIDFLFGENFMLSLNSQAFTSLYDVNAAEVKDLAWFDSYNVAYNKSYNFSWSGNVGLYYYIQGKRNKTGF